MHEISFNSQNLLVIRFGAMGDLIHVSPSLRQLRLQKPELKIHFLTSPLYESLVSCFEGVHRVWVRQKEKSPVGNMADIFNLSNELRRVPIDSVINLHPSFKTWLLSQLVLAHPGSTGLQTYHKEKLSVFGQGQRELLQTHKRRHAVDDFFEPFRRMYSLPKLTGNERLPRLKLPASLPKDREIFYSGQSAIALIPGVGAKRSNRAWLLSAYKTLIEGLSNSGQTHPLRLLIVGGPDEAAFASELTITDRVENHCGRHTLLETAQLLSECQIAIGGDTGPLHLAAALGVPTIGLFGPTSPERTGPLGINDAYMLLPDEHLDCWPCEQAVCRYDDMDKHLACMKSITVDQVLGTCRTILNNLKNNNR